jgi:hypothetical protein
MDSDTNVHGTATVGAAVGAIVGDTDGAALG